MLPAILPYRAMPWFAPCSSLFFRPFLGARDAQGCGEQMAEAGLVPQIVLGPVLAGVGDVHPRVRYAALACVGQMTEDFADWDGGIPGGDDGDGDDEEFGSFQGVFHAQVRLCVCLLFRVLSVQYHGDMMLVENPPRFDYIGVTLSLIYSPIRAPLYPALLLLGKRQHWNLSIGTRSCQVFEELLDDCALFMLF